MDHFKGSAGRKFKASYAHFWGAALRALGELDALQEVLLEPLQNLLTSLVWYALDHESTKGVPRAGNADADP